MGENPDFELSEPESLLFESSPYGSLDALVQQDSQAAYLYLHSPQNSEFGTRAVWVRNLKRGPLVVSQSDMQSGIAPLLPRTHCHHPDGKPPLDARNLELVWFEEGNGVALYEQGELLAVLPPWSGMDGFAGYARDCRSEHLLCWPLPQAEHLQRRIINARQYWQLWQTSNPFADYQEQWLERIKQQVSVAAERCTKGLVHQRVNGQASLGKYYAIDGGKWPPRGLQCCSLPCDSLTNPARADDSDNLSNLSSVLVSVGMGLTAMPNVEMSLEQPALARRAELAIRFGLESVPENESAVTTEIAQWLSGIVGYPWQQLTWIGHGHTGTMTLSPRAARAVAGSLVESHGAGAQNGALSGEAAESSEDPVTVPFLYVNDRRVEPSMPTMRQFDDPVNLLWVVPLTREELQSRLAEKVTTEQLLDALSQSGRLQRSMGWSGN